MKIYEVNFSFHVNDRLEFSHVCVKAATEDAAAAWVSSQYFPNYTDSWHKHTPTDMLTFDEIMYVGMFAFYNAETGYIDTP